MEQNEPINAMNTPNSPLPPRFDPETGKPLRPPVQPEAPVYQPPVQPETPVYQPPVQPEAPTYQPTAAPEAPVYQPTAAPQAPVYQPPVQPEAPVYRPTAAPQAPVYQPTAASQAPMYQPSVQPQAPVYQPPVQPTTDPVPVKKKNGKRILVIVLAAVLLLAVAAFCVWFFALRTPKAESIHLSKTTVTLHSDETEKLSYKILPEKAQDKSVTWTSSDERIASVDKDGNIIVHKGGTCQITASVDDVSDSLTLTVTNASTTEMVIVGKWYGQAAGFEGEIISFSKPITLNDDLTGSFSISDTVYDFTWAYSQAATEKADGIIVYEVKEGTSTYYIFYNQEDDLLTLVFTGDFMLFYER